jgi:hypothetical protein
MARTSCSCLEQVIGSDRTRLAAGHSRVVLYKSRAGLLKLGLRVTAVPHWEPYQSQLTELQLAMTWKGVMRGRIRLCPLAG